MAAIPLFDCSELQSCLVCKNLQCCCVCLAGNLPGRKQFINDCPGSSNKGSHDNKAKVKDLPIREEIIFKTFDQETTTTKETSQTVEIYKNDQKPTKPLYKHYKTIEGFKYPWGVAVNGSNGDIAVAEWGGNCVTLLDSQGRRKMSFGAKEKGRFRLQNPWGVLFTNDNHLLVTDSTRILKYTPQGKLVKYVGSKGNGQCQFDSAAGLSRHPHNHRIYIADSNNHRIQVLNNDLTFHTTFGSKGSERGKFYLPWGVSFDSKGMVYVAEGNSRIQKFTPDGSFVTAFGKKGDKAGEISRPASITIDKSDTLHLTDLYNNCIVSFDTSGEFVGSYGNHDKQPGTEDFNGPCGITMVEANGLMYVSDCWNNSVKIFTY